VTDHRTERTDAQLIRVGRDGAAFAELYLWSGITVEGCGPDPDKERDAD
jgi:hypothetical protein